MTTPFTAEIRAEPIAISALTEQAMEYLGGAGVDARATHHVALVIDEMLTNVVSHGAAPGGTVGVKIDILPDRVKAEILDPGLPFDPRAAPGPDLETDVENRAIGGVGLLLVRTLTCELDYERSGDRNRTRFAVARAST
jgi:anti-sigma regulatory factor (Ser/Thr protein kinase)